MVFEKGEKKQHAECNTNSPILHEDLLQALPIHCSHKTFSLSSIMSLWAAFKYACLYILLLEILSLFSIELFWRVLQKEFNLLNHTQATKSLAIYCQHLACFLMELSDSIQYPPTSAWFSHQITMTMSHRHWSIRIGAAPDGPICFIY